MKNMCRVVRLSRGNYLIITFKSCIIIAGCSKSTFIIFIQVFQFHTQYSSLNTVQTRIDTHHVVMITNHHTMIRDSPHFSCQFIVVRKNGTAIAKAPQIFRWKKGSTANITHTARMSLTSVFKRIYRTNRLTSIFHYEKIMFFSQR